MQPPGPEQPGPKQKLHTRTKRNRRPVRHESHRLPSGGCSQRYGSLRCIEAGPGDRAARVTARACGVRGAPDPLPGSTAAIECKRTCVVRGARGTRTRPATHPNARALGGVSIGVSNPVTAAHLASGARRNGYADYATAVGHRDTVASAQAELPIAGAVLVRRALRVRSARAPAPTVGRGPSTIVGGQRAWQWPDVPGLKHSPVV